MPPRGLRAQRAHETLKARLVELTEADKAAREARRAADGKVAEANRALSRAEAERSLAGSKLESLGLAVKRHEEEALAARKTLAEAEKAMGDWVIWIPRAPRSKTSR